MHDSPIRHIICAVRGRPGSQATVEHAIERAREHQARLTFFQVIDITFLSRAEILQMPVRGIYRQLHDMAEFIMLLLVQQATSAGVGVVDYELAQGDVRDELMRVAREHPADLLILGRPQPVYGKTTFSPGEIDSFIALMEAEQNLKVEQVSVATD